MIGEAVCLTNLGHVYAPAGAIRGLLIFISASACTTLQRAIVSRCNAANCIRCPRGRYALHGDSHFAIDFFEKSAQSFARANETAGQVATSPRAVERCDRPRAGLRRRD